MSNSTDAYARMVDRAACHLFRGRKSIQSRSCQRRIEWSAWLMLRKTMSATCHEELIVCSTLVFDEGEGSS